MRVMVPGSWVGAYEFACNVPECAPPPVGKGGSIKGRAAPTRKMSKKLAQHIAAKASAAEKEVTPLVEGIITAGGGRMFHLEHRLKTVDSLARKIHTKSRERGQSPGEAADKISDALRFTGVIKDPPKGNYTKTVRSIIKQMEKQGMTVLEMETHWKRGDAYNGVHVIAQHPNGTKVEIQFHTEESIAAKVKTHELYEKWRDPKTPGPERVRLAKEMVKIADAAPVPSGSLGLGAKVFRPVSSG